MNTFNTRRPGFGQTRTVCVDRTAEFKNFVEEIYRTGGGQPPLAGNASHQGGPSDIQRSQNYLSGLFANIEDQLKAFSQSLRKSSMQSLTPKQINNMFEELNRKLNDAGAGLDALEAQINTNQGYTEKQVQEHYRIMFNAFRQKMMDHTRELGRLLDQHQKAEVRRNERAKQFTHHRDPRDLESGMGEGAGEDLGEQLQTQFHRSRQDGMVSVQTALYEVSQLFSRVSTMVAQQNDYVESIYEDVDVASWNFSQGENELKKYLQNISGSRWLIIKIFAIFISFVVFFIAFIM